MPASISRHFVAVEDGRGPRQVHYRRAGQGPAVLLLHQSPQSSREMEPLLRSWGGQWTVIAPDSPGYGLSDPLGLDPASLDDFAAATLAFADAIGLGRFGVYGFHTGASIGLALARRCPERLTAVAANGLVVLDEAEIAAILAEYLPPLVPRWDGGHLAWLWARLREQAIFFPWHSRRLASRMDFDVAPPERLQVALNEFLAAGANYHVAYRAAFEYRAERLLPDLKVPVLVTAAARDPLAAHLTRIGDRSPAVRLDPAGDSPDALARCAGHLAAHPGDPAPSPPATTPLAGRPWRRYLGPAGHQLLLHQFTDGAGPPLLMVHGPGASGAAVRGVATRLGTGRPLLALDLPGHGGSDLPLADSPLDGACEAVLAALTGLGAADTGLGGVEGGALIALEAAGRSGSRNPPTLVDPPCWLPAETAAWRQEGLPPLTPLWHGGHLLEAWHMVRDSRLFYPWFRRSHAGIRWQEPDLDPGGLQAELKDLLLANGAWQQLLGDLLDYPLTDRLAAQAGRPVLLSTGTGLYAGTSGRLAGAVRLISPLPP